MKTCTICKETLSDTDFYPEKRTKNGLMARCKKCESIRSKEKTLRRKDLQYTKAKEWRDNNKDVMYNLSLTWRKQNPKKTAAYFVDYRNRNRGLVNERWARREALKRSATPSWLTEDDIWMMAEIYDLSSLRTDTTGIAWNVDHIIPLQGKTVSGLHVPWNLRIITARENRAKSNRIQY